MPTCVHQKQLIQHGDEKTFFLLFWNDVPFCAETAKLTVNPIKWWTLMNQFKLKISTFHCNSWIKPIKWLPFSICIGAAFRLQHASIYRMYMNWIAKDRALIRSECCIFSRFFLSSRMLDFCFFLLSFFLSMSKNHLKRSPHTIIMFYTFVVKYATKFIREREKHAQIQKSQKENYLQKNWTVGLRQLRFIALVLVVVMVALQLHSVQQILRNQKRSICSWAVFFVQFCLMMNS